MPRTYAIRRYPGVRPVRCLSQVLSSSTRNSPLQHADEMNYLRRYDRLATKAAFESIPGFRWCRCGSGQVHDAGYDSPKFECVSCRKRYCVVHNRRWHEGETCAEYDYRTDGTQRRAEEKASERLIKATAKKCPGCKGNVEKMSGCDHMTCEWFCELINSVPVRQEC